MSLSLHDLAVRVVDRTWPDVDLSDETIRVHITVARANSQLTWDGILDELRDHARDPHRWYDALMVRASQYQPPTPLRELADRCLPSNEGLIRTLAIAAIRFLAVLEIGGRQGPRIIYLRREPRWWTWRWWVPRRWQRRQPSG